MHNFFLKKFKMSVLYNRLLSIVKKKDEQCDVAKMSNMINLAQIKAGLTKEELKIHHDNIFLLIYTHYDLNGDLSNNALPKCCKILQSGKKNKYPPMNITASELSTILVKIINENLIKHNQEEQED